MHIIVRVGAALALTTILGAATKPPEARVDLAPTEARHEAAPRPPEAPHQSADEVQARKKAAMEQADLDAQMSMARSASIGMWVTIVGTVASVVGLAFVYLNLRATLQFNREVRKTNVDQLRAYMSISKASPKSFTVGMHGYVDVILDNTGQTPAVDFKVFGNIDLRPCEEPVSTEDMGDMEIAGTTVGAGGDTQLVLDLSEPLTQIAISNILNKVVHPVARLRVSYSDIFGNHYSEDFCMVGMVSNTGMIFMVPKDPTPR